MALPGGVAARSSRLLLALLLSVLGPGGVTAADTDVLAADSPASLSSRTDLAPRGNRVADGHGPLDPAAVIDVELPSPATWVLPDPSGHGDAWLVVLDDGTVVQVVARVGEEPSLTLGRFAPLRPGEPPAVSELGGGQLAIGSALEAARVFEDPLPGTRVVEAPSGALVALTAPTDRYPHAVLGDDLEAGALSVLDPAGLLTTITLADDEVIEGLSAIVADLDDDGVPELVVTVSTAETGARLAVYELDGSEVARSEAIGQGFRWLHQIAVGPTGPGGETELIVVRTPHIGGVVEAYRLDGDRLERVASRSGYSSHRLGSANLDMALLADVDGDDHLDVVVPDQAMASLRVLGRVDDGFSPLGSLELGGPLATNVAATADLDGRLVLAAGTTDGRLRVFR